MSTDIPTQNRTKVVVIGLSKERARLLGSAIERVGKDSFVLEYWSGSFAELLKIGDVDDAIILAGSEGLPEHKSSLTVAQELRTEHFFWQPIHLLMRVPPRNANYEHDWSIYLHRLPPEDVRSLAEILVNSKAVSTLRRVDIVTGAIVKLKQELGSLIRSLDPNLAAGPEAIRGSVGEVLSMLQPLSEAEGFKELRTELVRISNAPIISARDLKTLGPLLISAENLVREPNKTNELGAGLHRLINKLRRAEWKPETATDVAKRIEPLLNHLQSRGLAALPLKFQERGVEICKSILDVIQESDGDEPSRLSDRLSKLATELNDLSRLLEPQTSSYTDTAVERIIVVEDDPEWRRLIVGVLKSMFLPLEIFKAGTVSEAESLLEEKQPALVLVDLGLPYDQDSEVILDAGLSLIKRFSHTDVEGKRLRHRFIVLTAAENYAEAVRSSIGMGVAPFNYLQKHSQVWESELRSRVRLSLHPPMRRLPNVEIFKRTRRIARVEGLEVKLDYPQWCLLAVFAESHKQSWCSTNSIARVLANSPYSLDPESRGGDTDNLDPEDRIRRQLPHYVSNLRARLTQAYIQSTHEPPPKDFISFDDDTNAYRLNANARVLERVEDHYRVGRRPSVLVVEDDKDWGKEIVEDLRRQGFEPRWARWTDEARLLIEEQTPDLLSLDIELPATETEWLDGQPDANRAVEFLQYIRRDLPDIPVVILTGIPWKDSVMLKMLQHDVRIDDYLSKRSEQPLMQLAGSLSRLWQEFLTQTRILDWDMNSPLSPIEIDPKTGFLKSVAGYEIKPPSKSGAVILKVLCETPNVFVSRADLIDAVYPDPDSWPDDVDNALDLHVSRLRRSITETTNYTVSGQHVICGDRGVLWLRGIVQ